MFGHKWEKFGHKREKVGHLDFVTSCKSLNLNRFSDNAYLFNVFKVFNYYLISRASKLFKVGQQMDTEFAKYAFSSY